jgi:hypothetical protein
VWRLGCVPKSGTFALQIYYIYSLHLTLLRVQHFIEAQITAFVVEIFNDEMPHAVMKVDTDDYFDKHKVVQKLESDGAGGFKTIGGTTKWFGSLKDFDLVKGKLNQEVRNRSHMNKYLIISSAGY